MTQKGEQLAVLWEEREQNLETFKKLVELGNATPELIQLAKVAPVVIKIVEREEAYSYFGQKAVNFFKMLGIIVA